MTSNAEAEKLAQTLNLIHVSIMAAGFLSPMLLFWGAVFGPLRPLSLPQVSLQQALIAAVLCVASGIVAVAANERYFTIRSFERNGEVYRRLSMLWIRRFITNGDEINRYVRARHPGYTLVDANDFDTFEQNAVAAERGHLFLFLTGVATAIFALLLQLPIWAAVITLGNIVENLLAIILQRYNRGRITGIRTRKTHAHAVMQ